MAINSLAYGLRAGDTFEYNGEVFNVLRVKFNSPPIICRKGKPEEEMVLGVSAKVLIVGSSFPTRDLLIKSTNAEGRSALPKKRK